MITTIVLVVYNLRNPHIYPFRLSLTNPRLVLQMRKLRLGKVKQLAQDHKTKYGIVRAQEQLSHHQDDITP